MRFPIGWHTQGGEPNELLQAAVAWRQSPGGMGDFQVDFDGRPGAEMERVLAAEDVDSFMKSMGRRPN